MLLQIAGGLPDSSRWQQEGTAILCQMAAGENCHTPSDGRGTAILLQMVAGGNCHTIPCDKGLSDHDRHITHPYSIVCVLINHETVQFPVFSHDVETQICSFGNYKKEDIFSFSSAL